MEQKRILNVTNKFVWKIIPTENGFTGVCDRLKLTTEAATIEELVDMAASASALLLADLYDTGEFNDYAFKHSVDHTFTDITNYMSVAPDPIVITAK